MKLTLPTPHTILLIIAALVAILTWIVPAGIYDTLAYDSNQDIFIRISSGEQQSFPAEQETLDALNIQIPLEKFTSEEIFKPISIPGTYRKMPAQPQGVVDFILSPVKGILDAAGIIVFVLILGGTVGLMNYTGAFNAGIAWLSRVMRGKEFGLIIIVTFLCAIGGSTFGLGEETIAFYPILIPVFIAAGYDSLVGLSAIFIGSSLGVMCSTTNPFSTIIASNTAGISWTTGMEFRLLMLFLVFIICLIYCWRYARKVKIDPSASIVSNDMHPPVSGETPALTVRTILMIFVFSMCFILMIYGVSMLGWWFEEMSGVFLAAGIIIGILARIPEKVLVSEFIKGASELLGVALIIGLARGVTVLMNEGMISDTILFHASEITTGMNKGLFAGGLTLIYCGLSFFISSTSGLAVLTMPVISPLADTVGVGREIVVNAYLFGTGLLSFISPTALILPSLEMAKVSYGTWLKYMLPLLGILAAVSITALTLLVYL